MKPKLLVVDDSLTIRISLQQLLGTEFSVSLVGSVAAAEHLLATERFELVLLDLNLPGENGMALLERPREAGKALPPVVVLSGDLVLDQRIRCLRSGTASCVSKPYSAAYLLRRVRALCGGTDGLATYPIEGPGHVLVVDDSGTYGMALSAALSEDGHDVAFAQSGADALRYLERHWADCAVLDVWMGDMSGLELCTAIRQTHARPLHLLMLTGRDRGDLRAAAFEAGIDEFETKNKSLPELRETVAALMARGAGTSSARRTPPHNRAPVPMPAKPPFPRDGSWPTPAASPERSQPSSATHCALFDRVVRETGLTEMFGVGSVERACRRAGVDPATLTADGILLVLPHLRQSLGFFLPATEVEERLGKIAALATRRR